MCPHMGISVLLPLIKIDVCDGGGREFLLFRNQAASLTFLSNSKDLTGNGVYSTRATNS